MGRNLPIATQESIRASITAGDDPHDIAKRYSTSYVNVMYQKRHIEMENQLGHDIKLPCGRLRALSPGLIEVHPPFI